MPKMTDTAAQAKVATDMVKALNDCRRQFLRSHAPLSRLFNVFRDRGRSQREADRKRLSEMLTEASEMFTHAFTDAQRHIVSDALDDAYVAYGHYYSPKEFRPKLQFKQ